MAHLLLIKCTNANAPMNELIHWVYVVREARVAQ